MGINHGVTRVLVSAANASNVNNILSSIIEGCADIPDMIVHKTCFSILNNLVLQWGGAGAGADGSSGATAAGGGAGGEKNGAGVGGDEATPQIRAAFRQFALEQIVPVIFKCPLQPHFDLEDAGASMV